MIDEPESHQNGNSSFLASMNGPFWIAMLNYQRVTWLNHPEMDIDKQKHVRYRQEPAALGLLNGIMIHDPHYDQNHVLCSLYPHVLVVNHVKQHI